MAFRKPKSEASKMEKIAEASASGVLVDHLSLQASSLGNCVRMYKEVADPIALEQVIENAEAAVVLARELLRRRDAQGVAFVPAPDPHVQSLLDEYQRRHITSPGTPAP